MEREKQKKPQRSYREKCENIFASMFHTKVNSLMHINNVLVFYIKKNPLFIIFNIPYHNIPT